MKRLAIAAMVATVGPSDGPVILPKCWSGADRPLSIEYGSVKPIKYTPNPRHPQIVRSAWGDARIRTASGAGLAFKESVHAWVRRPDEARERWKATTEL